MAAYLGVCADAELVPFGPAGRESRNEHTEPESKACQLSCCLFAKPASVVIASDRGPRLGGAVMETMQDALSLRRPERIPQDR